MAPGLLQVPVELLHSQHQDGSPTQRGRPGAQAEGIFLRLLVKTVNHQLEARQLKLGAAAGLTACLARLDIEKLPVELNAFDRVRRRQVE